MPSQTTRPLLSADDEARDRDATRRQAAMTEAQRRIEVDLREVARANGIDARRCPWPARANDPAH